MPSGGAMRSFSLLIAVVACWLVIALLVLLGAAIMTCQGDCALPKVVGLPILFGGLAGMFVALWLWDVYQKSRTKRRYRIR